MYIKLFSQNYKIIFNFNMYIAVRKFLSVIKNWDIIIWNCHAEEGKAVLKVLTSY